MNSRAWTAGCHPSSSCTVITGFRCRQWRLRGGRGSLLTECGSLQLFKSHYSERLKKDNTKTPGTDKKWTMASTAFKGKPYRENRSETQWLVWTPKDKTAWLMSKLTLCLRRRWKVASVPQPRVRAPAPDPDDPRQDKHQKTEAAHHAQHDVERVWNPGVRAGRWGHHWFWEQSKKQSKFRKR